MGTSTVPVDLFNPGQVFACVGLVEATLMLTGRARGCFRTVAEGASFELEGASADPLGAVKAFLGNATVTSFAPNGSDLTTDKWSVPTIGHRPVFPFPTPESPATLPAELRDRETVIGIDYWGDSTVRDNVKFWAGAAGYPGVGLLRDALDLARPLLESDDPFNQGIPQSSSFRFDWRRDYIPLDAGFSLNKHGDISPQGFPIVEILAAIGMSHARPERPERRNKLVYRYGVPMDVELPAPLLRVALGCSPLPFHLRTFRITLGWPGKEGQARCITDVVEET